MPVGGHSSEASKCRLSSASSCQAFFNSVEVQSKFTPPHFCTINQSIQETTVCGGYGSVARLFASANVQNECFHKV